MSEKQIESIKQFVVFILQDTNTNEKESFGVAIDQIQEIRVLESLTKVPKAQNYVKGITNLRGNIVSIIDLKKMLDMGKSDDSCIDSHVLITDIGGTVVGLLVDDIDQVMRISESNISPAPKGVSSNKYVEGIAKVNDKLILLVDLRKLLQEDVEALQEISKESN